MTSGKPPGDDLPDHVFRWLEAVTRRMGAELSGLEFGGPAGLGGGQRRILQMIPAGGIRITDLALIAGMTKQATGEFADRLEAGGLAVSRRDDRDRRARLVARTPAGDAAAAETSRAIAAVEQRWREEVGPARYDAMKAVLRELGGDSLRPGPGRPDYRPDERVDPGRDPR
jgi:DNA-binding MarR family transcriptional regulator